MDVVVFLHLVVYDAVNGGVVRLCGCGRLGVFYFLKDNYDCFTGWCCVTRPPLLPPLIMASHFSFYWRY